MEAKVKKAATLDQYDPNVSSGISFFLLDLVFRKNGKKVSYCLLEGLLFL